jgi:hypothetical protein
MRSRIALLLACVLAAACANESARAPAESPRAAVQVAAKPAAAAVGAFDDDTVGCQLIPKRQFATPEELVHEWVGRDTLGLFIEPGDRLFELMSCPGHSGGGDEVVVAVDPVITRGSQRGDSVAFLVTYRRLGQIGPDQAGEHALFSSEPGVDSLRVTTVRTPYGWRFPSDVANPHLSPRVVLEKWPGVWDAASRDTLRAIAARLAR